MESMLTKHSCLWLFIKESRSSKKQCIWRVSSKDIAKFLIINAICSESISIRLKLRNLSRMIGRSNRVCRANLLWIAILKVSTIEHLISKINLQSLIFQDQIRARVAPITSKILWTRGRISRRQIRSSKVFWDTKGSALEIWTWTNRWVASRDSGCQAQGMLLGQHST